MSKTLVRKAGSAIASIVLAMLGISALALLVLGIVARPGHDGISRLAGHPVLTVLSGSMTPVFRPGDMIVDDPITPLQAGRLVPGDIITFHVTGSSTELITHRIVRIETAQGSTTQVRYQTKGDANNTPDQDLVSPSQVVGTYSTHVPFGGYFLQAVQKKVVFFFLILLPLLYLIGTEVAKRWNAPSDATDHPHADGEQPVRELVTAASAHGGSRGEGEASV